MKVSRDFFISRDDLQLLMIKAKEQDEWMGDLQSNKEFMEFQRQQMQQFDQKKKEAADFRRSEVEKEFNVVNDEAKNSPSRAQNMALGS